MTGCTTSECGTGTGNFPQPGDPDLNSSILTAVARFGGIQLNWTYPSSNAHAVAHTIIYRSGSNSFATASEYAIATGNRFFDQNNVEVNTTYYYWIRIVSVNGTVGLLIGPAWATALPLPQDIINLLVGRIENSLLNHDLRTEINRIVGLESSLSAEQQERLLGDTVFSQMLAQYQNQLEAIDTLVVNETLERIDADSALVAQLNLLLAQSNGNAAAILLEQAVRADADSATALSVQTLQTEVGENLASLQTTQLVVDGLTAQYMVKTDVNGFVSGFGLYSDSESSDFIVNASNFAVVTPGENPQYPFIIGLVNGSAQIVMTAPTYWGNVIGSEKPQDGATRNVFRGTWSTALGAVAVGDVVLDNGSSWSAKTAHTAATGNRPPATGDSNTYWNRYAAKGDQGVAGPVGAGTTTIYQRSTSIPAIPGSGTANPPTGWFSTVPGGTAPVWESRGNKAAGGTVWSWTVPQMSTEHWRKTGTTTIDGGVIATDTAFIYEAMIHEAQISTLLLEGHALVVPSQGSRGSLTANSGANYELCRTTITIPDVGQTTQSVMVNWYVNQAGQNADAQLLTMQLIRGPVRTVLWTQDSSNRDDWASGCHVDFPPVGTYDYVLEMNRIGKSGTVQVHSASIVVSLVKR